VKQNIMRQAAENLTTEDQDMLRRLGEATRTDGTKPALDMDLRADLCAEMAEMAESVRSLLTLLNRHGFLETLPDKAHPAYQSVMRRIGASALRGQTLLARSDALDKDTLLAVMPEHNKRLN